MRFIFFDLETGGLAPSAPIIQIAGAVVDIHTWEVQETFERKCQFLEPTADPEALRINSYDPEVWKADAVELKVAMADFNRLCSQCADVEQISKKGNKFYTAQLAGYNTEAFDMPRLRGYYSERGIFFQGSFWSYDVLQLARWKMLHERHKNHKLTTVCEYLGIEHNAHDALGDVLATVEVARRLMNA